MTVPTISSLKVENFRSIGDSIAVPMDAPVVLIHGPNGSGKTSLLAALEMSLTGELPAMRRADPSYRSQLIHRGSTEGRIAVSYATGGSSATAEYGLNSVGTLKGEPLLAPAARRFFSERCYLAQSTLSRLLEIYASPADGPESPLKRFVDDLLNLDQLDALISGLHSSRDVRNIRKSVLDWAPKEREQQEVERRIGNRRSSRVDLVQRQNSLNEELANALNSADADLEPPEPGSVISAEQVRARLDRDEAIAATAAALVHEVDIAVRRAAQVAFEAMDAQSLANAEEVAARARSERQRWDASVGQSLEQLIDRLRRDFPDLPSISASEPVIAIETATANVTAEFTRCHDALVRDDNVRLQISSTAENFDRSRARLSVLDEQLAEGVDENDGLAKALVALIPYATSDRCPVCSRDFSEVTDESLAAHISNEAARLSELAERLRATANARREAATELAAAERLLASLYPDRLAQDALAALQLRQAEMTDLLNQLVGVQDDAARGTLIVRRDAEARRDLARLRDRAREFDELRLLAADLCRRARVSPLEEDESIEPALKRVRAAAVVESTRLRSRLDRRRRVLELLGERESVVVRLREEEGELRALEGRLAEIERSLDVANQRMLTARRLEHAGVDARMAVIRRVFNDSLNAVWRDLFVRLAPSEPFVPAFEVAEGSTTARMVTHDRAGHAAGTPATMLSAGNLNTAALTLFLSLHLSVKPTLPWLVLDDPVQSMDDVHISQFAALLRTLTKQHGRRAVVAVHERPLFDYLRLELAPSFPGDRLITIGLKARPREGIPPEVEVINYEPESAFAVA